MIRRNKCFNPLDKHEYWLYIDCKNAGGKAYYVLHP